MSYADLISNELTSAAEDTRRRRKVRKGTQSCWECKRRKVRCTFATSEHDVCKGCAQRGTICLSQEFPDVGSSTNGNGQAKNRYNLFETLLERLVESTSSSGPPNVSTNGLSSQKRDSCGKPKYPANGAVYHKHVEPTIVGLTLAHGGDEMSIVLDEHAQNTAFDFNCEAGRQSENRPLIKTLSLSTIIPPVLSAPSSGNYKKLCSALLTAWPSKHDLDIIIRVPVETTWCLHGLICTPPDIVLTQTVSSPHEVLQPPSPGSHPVTIARQLLLLATYIQAVPSAGIQTLVDLNIKPHDIMLSAFDTARGLVNCNDELVASLEGIECLTIESMFHNDAGNLRRSWLTVRRAMLIAQTMGIHRGGDIPSVEAHGRSSTIGHEYIYFRLVQADRYLSMMLGLPQGASASKSFATAKALEKCPSAERLERIECVVSGRILQRNEADIKDLAVTMEIDQMLQNAAMSMPSRWWLISNLVPSISDKIEHYHQTVRMMIHFAHFHLLIRLHLPYLLRPSTDHRYDYSKATAAYASREILARFLSFRTSVPVNFYCRGVDYCVFIASITLCLIHINGHHQTRNHENDNIDISAHALLVHQRPSDRGLMEYALENFETVADSNGDTIASDIATMLRPLLAIENEAAEGGSYSTSSHTTDTEGVDCRGRSSDSGKVLRIYVPSFGTIKIERGGVSKLPNSLPENDVAPLNTMQTVERTSADLEVPVVTASSPEEDQSEHPLPVSYDYATDIDQPLMSCLDPDPDLDLDLGAEDWHLQGLDTAFFDCLIRGSESDAGESVDHIQ